MGRPQRVFRRIFGLSIGAVMLLVALGPISARAQVMHDDGIPLPWFHSRAQQMARQACEDNLPECRDSVRRQLATEKIITTIAPWVILCLIILGAVVYVRRRDAAREEKRHQAARHHVREAHRTPRTQRDSDGADERAADGDMDDMDGGGMGVGHPSDHRR